MFAQGDIWLGAFDFWLSQDIYAWHIANGCLTDDVISDRQLSEINLFISAAIWFHDILMMSPLIRRKYWLLLYLRPSK